MVQTRHAIHRQPELGNKEVETAARIERFLVNHGIETQRVLGTAVVGTLRGALPGKTVALRADIDALPIQEETGAAFTSVMQGRMHACGHDVHTAAVLGAAAVLAAHREELAGNVVFLFQPDEEGNGGAARLIDRGCLDGVDAIFGAHVSPDLPEGHAGFCYGKFYAASDMFELTVTGKSAHGADREKGIDALAAAAELVTELLALPAKVTEDRCVVTVGTLQSGTAGNILAGSARMTGIVRTLGKETRQRLKEAFFETVERVSEAHGTKTEIRYRQSYPGIVNDPAMAALAERASAELLEEAQIHRISRPTMTTEDFGYYLDRVPGAFYHIGAGSEEPLHSPLFLPSDRAVTTAAAVHVAVVLDFLTGGDA